MANTINAARSGYDSYLDVTGPTGSYQKIQSNVSTDLTPMTHVIELKDYVLTTAAGALDIDLYDLGTLDVGAGAGRDNLGNTWAQAKVLSVFIENTAASLTGVLTIDQNAVTATAWGGLFGTTAVTALPASAQVNAFMGAAGSSITDVTDHVIRLVASTATVTLNLVITTIDV